MKIAGRKNDGAWYRANKEVQGFAEGPKDALKTQIAALPSLQAFINVMLGIADEIGLDLSDTFGGNGAYAAMLVDHGIPRQVWQGRLSYTVYDKVTVDGVQKYIPRGQSEAHYFAKELRKVVTKFIFARREVADVGNIGNLATGNPGGLPDASATQ